MNTIAWIVVFAYLALTVLVGLWFSRRAHRSASEYFLSGQSLPWWLLGTSMVITTFAPDTPVGVAEYARTGLFNGWFGWNMVMQQVLAVFLFARLWRRSGVKTDNELVELRYSGRPAAGLRLFKALHFSILGNIFSLCVVIAALVEVLSAVIRPEDIHALTGWTLSEGALREWIRFGLTALTVVYALLAGFWGVIATDFFQFFIAMTGTVVFAWIALDDFGGLPKLHAAVDATKLAIFPSDGDTIAKILVYMFVMWWGIYNADGGGYLSQRMIAAKDERHASLGTLWFSFAYAGLRMWPWLLIGSLSLVLFPTLGVGDGEDLPLVNGRPASTIEGTVIVGSGTAAREVELAGAAVALERTDGATRVVLAESGEPLRGVTDTSAWPRMMLKTLGGREDILHALVLGALVAAFLAAFMSTVDTLLNWGGSYIVHDVLQRFVWRQASEKKLLLASKVFALVIVTLALFASQAVTSIKDAWIFVWGISAGLGPIVILRWFWWRVNAWSEISALIASLACAGFFELANRIALGADGYVFAASSTTIGLAGEEPWIVLARWHKILVLVGVALSVGLIATLCTRPVEAARLDDFARKVRPPGAWGPVRARVGAAAKPEIGMRRIFASWLGGLAAVYGFTFAIGGLVYGLNELALGSILIGCLGAFVISRSLRALGRTDAN